MMKHNGMRLLAIALACLFVLPLGLTACEDVFEPAEPKTAESVLQNAMQKLSDALAKNVIKFTPTDKASVEMSADLSALLETLTGGKTECTLSVKSFQSGAVQLNMQIGEEQGDLAFFFAGDEVILQSETLFGGKGYSYTVEELIPILLDWITITGGDEPIDGPEEDLYYLGDPETEGLWYVFEGINAESRFPMDTYVAGDFDSVIAVFLIEDAAEVVPSEALENYEFKDGFNYVFGDEALYGFTAETECVMLDAGQYVLFYGNDGESYVVFDVNSYSYIEDDNAVLQDENETPDYAVSDDMPTDVLSLFFGAQSNIVREILDYAKNNADALTALFPKMLDAAKASFKTNSAWALEEAKPLTVHNHEMTVDNVTITVTERQFLTIAVDVLNAIKNEAALTAYLSKVASLTGEEITVDALIAEISGLATDFADQNNIKLIVSVDTETGLPAKAVLQIYDTSKENEDVPRTVSFDAMTVELIDGYVGLTLADEDGPQFRITTTWDTDAERTMAQTFFYLPMEDENGKEILGEQLMIDWTFYADKTYDISIVTGDLKMISFNGSYEFSETEEMMEIATVSVTDGEAEIKLPIHLKLKLRASDTAPEMPTDYQHSTDAADIREALDFFFERMLPY